MGTYYNPGNGAFCEIVRDRYIDKSGMIALINDTINSPRKFTCVSRPRRFGKSFTAKMLCAYYDRSCDSRELFKSLKIYTDESCLKYMNKYDVIYLDMAYLKTFTSGYKNLISYVNDTVMDELKRAYNGITETVELPGAMIQATEISGKKFVMIIDEWDAPIRENVSIQREYLDFLRTLFKGSGTSDRIFSAVYMTGILPIKKDGSQSALSDFREYTMTYPGIFSEYVGFTTEEVKNLCDSYGADFEEIKRWYDGYLFEGISVYNPNSVMSAVTTGKLKSYWTQSSAIDNLIRYISMDFDGLSKTTAELTGGAEVYVNVNMFDNDLVSFRNKDSVLALLIHLGYLSYNDDTGMAQIPNEEIRIEFSDKIKEVKTDETMKRVAESNKLIMDTVQKDADAVAAQIEKVHLDETSPLFYNSEQTLRSIIKLAYFAYKDYYLKFEELPAGEGFADLLYLPRQGIGLPALLIELKWNESAEGAIGQIRKKNYPRAVKEYGGEILLVGINYDKNAPAGKRKHSCVIENL